LFVKALIMIFLAGTSLELMTTDAEARAGRGRSSGRSSSSDRSSSSSDSRQSQATPPPATNPSAMANPARGGFMRSMAGAVAGGFLGSMLFSSLSNASTGEGGGKGGIGLLEVALFAGLAYFGFRWWKSRQQAAGAFGAIAQRHQMPSAHAYAPEASHGIDFGRMRGLDPSGIDPDVASDIFFKVQGAWTRRDLSSLAGLLGRDVELALERDLRELREDRQINRLENISVRSATVTRTWHEDRAEYSSVRFTASLLDYTVDETTNQVVDGSDAVPVKFEEEWTFGKFAGEGSWTLVGIQQV